MNIIEIVAYINDSIYVINILTTIGSVFSIIIFSRKSFEKSTIGIYCKLLAIFDLSVIFNLSVGIASISINNNRSLLRDTEWICKMMTYVVAVFSAMTGWILVFFSVDQLINVSMTQRFLFYKKKWFQYSLILGLFIFHCLFYIPMIFTFNLINKIENGNISVPSCATSSIVLPIVLFAEATLIPLIILLILTAVIGRYLSKSRRKVTNDSRSKTSNGQQVISSTKTTAVDNRRAHEFKYAFNSVILNIMHIVLLTPLLIFVSIPFSSFEYFLLFNVIAYVFSALNNALHFLVHFGVNSIFRKEVFILIRSCYSF